MYNGTMYLSGTDEDNVVRLKFILSALDCIAHIAAEKNQYLMKVMIMKAEFFLPGISYPEYFKIAVKIACPYVFLLRHDESSFCCCGSPYFWSGLYYRPAF